MAGRERPGGGVRGDEGGGGSGGGGGEGAGNQARRRALPRVRPSVGEKDEKPEGLLGVPRALWEAPGRRGGRPPVV